MADGAKQAHDARSSPGSPQHKKEHSASRQHGAAAARSSARRKAARVVAGAGECAPCKCVHSTGSDARQQWIRRGVHALGPQQRERQDQRSAARCTTCSWAGNGNTGSSFAGGKKRHRPMRKVRATVKFCMLRQAAFTSRQCMHDVEVKSRNLQYSLWQERELNETEQQFTLQRFVPLLRDVVEDLVDGKLPQSEYVSISAPKPDIKAGKWPALLHPESTASCMIGRTDASMIHGSLLISPFGMSLS
jgi:hypothetical protein